MALSPEQEAQLKAAPPEQRYRYFARRLATKYGIDPDLYEAQIQTESTWRPDAVGEQTKYGVARGLAQFIPDTGAKYGLKTDADFLDPVKSLDAGARYMRDLTQQEGSQEKGILTYHGGPGPKGDAYVQTVLATAEKLRQARAGATQAPAPTNEPPPPAEAPSSPLGPQSAAAAQAPGSAPAAPEPTWADTARSAVGAADEFLGQAAQGAVNSVTGLRNLAQAPVNALSGAAGLPPYQPMASREGAIAGAPTTTVGRYGRAVGEGAPFGPAGMAGGAIGEAGGDVTEAAGLGRGVGEITAPLLTAGVGGVRALRKNLQAVKPLGKAEAAAAATAKTAAAKEAEAQADITKLLLPATPEQRAEILGSALRSEHKDFRKFRGEKWDRFMAQHGQTPVDLKHFNVTAEDLIDHMVKSGVSKDEAIVRARDALRLMTPAQEIVPGVTPSSVLAGGPHPPPQMTAAVTTIPLENAQALRSELGQIFGRAKGVTESRAGKLYGTLNQAVEDAIPKGALPEWRKINAISKREVQTYRNKLVKRIFDDSPEGAIAAEKTIVGMLSSGWTPKKAVELRALTNALGTNTAGHEVLKDAVLRHAYGKFTNRDGVTQWGHMAGALRNPDGLAPMFSQVVRDPRERSLVLKIIDEAAEARQTATLAAETAKTVKAEALAANQSSAFDYVARNLFRLAGFTSGGVPGFLAAEGSLRGLRAMRFLTRRENRAALRSAMSTTADSAAGRRLIQRLAPNVEGQAPRLLAGPQPVAADAEQPPPTP